MIELDRITVQIDAVRVLSNVTLRVRPGDAVALVGANGVGKTTLLRVISGEVRPASGRVLVEGRDPTHARARIGLMPHEPGLHPALTVAEQLCSFGRLYGLSGHPLRSRVHELLHATGLLARRHLPTRTLSAGMLRRLSLGCALVHAPAIVLLDEPTENMDAESRARVGTMVAALRARGASLVFTTHDAQEADALATRVLRLSGGRIASELACAPTGPS